MRWDNLFDDLESQLEQGLEADDVDQRAEEERLRLSRLTLRDRLISIQRSGGDRAILRLRLSDGSPASVRPATFGKDWISGDLVEESARGSQCIVSLAAVGQVALDRQEVTDSLGVAALEPTGSLASRLGIAFVLRDLCRRRRSVELLTAFGTVHGTIDRVGRDHLDLAVHERGTARRENEVVQYRMVSFGQLLLVRLD